MTISQNKNNYYSVEFLISELVRFNEEKGRPPTSKDLDKRNTGYPSRKTYTKYFGSFGNALINAGFEYRGNENSHRKKPLPNGVVRFTKEQIRKSIDEYIKLHNKVPSLKEFESIPDYPIRADFRRLFGGYNNALKEFGYKVNQVSHYTDQELKSEFMKFVSENGRVPTIHEFNNSDYPSFWCYQNRFGSWNKAVEAYGFTPNNEGTGFNFIFEDGEVVKSKYEFDVSTYFRNNNITYDRNVPYKNHIENYNGRRDCDYVLTYKNQLLFIEVAGLYTNKENKSSMEKDYVKRFDVKLKLIKNANLNFLIIYPEDFKTKSLDEIFSLLSN